MKKTLLTLAFLLGTLTGVQATEPKQEPKETPQSSKQEKHPRGSKYKKDPALEVASREEAITKCAAALEEARPKGKNLEGDPKAHFDYAIAMGEATLAHLKAVKAPHGFKKDARRCLGLLKKTVTMADKVNAKGKK